MSEVKTTIAAYARAHGRSWHWAKRRLMGLPTREDADVRRRDPFLAVARANGVNDAQFRMRKSRGYSSEVAAMDWSEVLP